jgi:4-hydroxybenzoate polyprenyltransferase/phosphoserine phosphatase
MMQEVGGTDNSKESQLIFVDLDQTLVRTDLFIESLLLLLKQNPLRIIFILSWLVRGISYAKHHIAQKVDIDVTSLPWEIRLLEYLKEQRALGRPLFLATAAPRRYAEEVAAHLGIFDGVLATDANLNMKGRAKLEAIREIAGTRNFTYAGDSAADSIIWKEAASSIFVNAPAQDVGRAEAAGKAERIIVSRGSLWGAFLREMRPHQYAKNILIFVPLLTSHELVPVASILEALAAFLCFCLCASGVYFLNDLLDLPSDRRHASKRQRPLASGNLTPHTGVLGAALLPGMAFAVALAFLPGIFILVLALYFLISNAYSFALKRISTADVITLAILYTLRVVAGGAATGIALSSWLLAFSVFVFVSLGYLKRYIEVASISSDRGKAPGRGYSGADSETMFSLGVANITASVLILALYINSDEVIQYYRTPEILWILCFLMLYWGNRIWVGARRGKIADDPIVFAINDRVSRLVGVAFVLVTLAAKYVKL